MSSFDGLSGPYPCRCGHDATAHHLNDCDGWRTQYPCSVCLMDECSDFSEADDADPDVAFGRRGGENKWN